MYLWIDGTSLLTRFFLQLRHLAAPDGYPTGGLWGTCRYLFRLLADHRPAACAVALDTPGRTFRHALDPRYKAQRTGWSRVFARQVAHLAELLTALGIPVVQAPGFEADDCIATLVAKSADGTPVRVVTGDRDLLTLASERVTITYCPPGIPLRAAIAVVPEWVRREFGVEPSQLPHLRVLLGDPADGIPGVPGVGPSEARRLLRRYPTIPLLLEALRREDAELGAAAERLLPHAAAMSRALALLTLRTDVPLPASPSACRLRPPGEELEELCRRYGFHSWLRRRPWEVWSGFAEPGGSG